MIKAFYISETQLTFIVIILDDLTRQVNTKIDINIQEFDSILEELEFQQLHK